MNAGVPVGLGVLTAFVWGTGDFCGGLASKRSPALSVAMVGQASACLALGLAALLSPELFPARATLVWALLAGLGSALGTSSLYAALARGEMALAAPIAALITAVVPVGASFWLEGTPMPMHVAGFALAGCAIWLLSRGSAPGGRGGLGLALLAGLGFGASLVSMRMAGQSAIVWPLFLARVSGFVVLLAVSLWRRERLPEGVRARALAASTGLFDTLGNGLFILATRIGRLDVLSALAALYPASTLLLARVVLGERTNATQRIGLALTACAVVLLAL